MKDTAWMGLCVGAGRKRCDMTLGLLGGGRQFIHVSAWRKAYGPRIQTLASCFQHIQFNAPSYVSNPRYVMKAQKPDTCISFWLKFNQKSH